MTFAQRSVAGEENTRLDADSADAAGIVPPARKRLKRKTIEAVELATRIQGLGRSARAALVALARTASNDDPNGRIFKHRETLCAETGMSAATWYRVQKELLSLGLITVDAQVRKRYGRFAGAYIYLTKQATDMLGLTEPTDMTAGKAEGSATPSHEEAEGVRPSVTLPTLKTRVPFTEERNPYPIQKGHQGELPQDLQRLRTLDFDKKLVFWLMRRARQHGHLLSEIVECTWESLVKAASPKAYLLSLIGKPTDYAGLVRLRVTQREAALEAKRKKAVIKLTMAEAARKTYRDPSGRIYEVESDGQSVLVHGRSGEEGKRRIVGQDLIRFAEALQAGVVTQTSSTAVPAATGAVEAPKRSASGSHHLNNLKAMMGVRRSTVLYTEKEASRVERFGCAARLAAA
ncbi:replication protein RepA [Cupriavidus sp. AU9028]|uniref:helix-turn-helix domain-containing protein n=1 Tax=Cupriavidus sp. AU9028 TaxID=2871157 RepID=UPI001C989DD9|nr:replication protein RepA [Cupriavidus sp. AU9028]MBY4898628.1 replication protein RepA [Cupriavidus sp. AU9028]